jgi:photosystem II stability/assembly factor-like uncharacterized protein
MRPVLLPILLCAVLLPAAAFSAGSPLKGRLESVEPETDVSLFAVTAFPSGTVYACGGDGNFLVSKDGGKTWDLTQVREEATLRVMCFVDEQRGFIAGRVKNENVLFTTRDGGAKFQEIKVDLPAYVTGLVFRDANTGWLVAGSERTRDGLWRITTDGGRTWVPRESVAFGTPARKLNAIAGVGEQVLVAVGSHVQVALVGEAARSLLYQRKRGGVLRSDDGGQTFEVQDPGNADGTELFAVDFFDSKHGFVAGDGGFAASTADGGQTWKILKTGTEVRLLGVDALSAETAVFVGENGTALATNDGGERFIALNTGTEANLRDASFTDERTGFVAGAAGTLLRFVREW